MTRMLVINSKAIDNGADHELRMHAERYLPEPVRGEKATFHRQAIARLRAELDGIYSGRF